MLATLEMMQIDAFTSVPLEGNPCAVVFDADPLDDNVMQATAREMNLSETAFVLESEIADYRARYFTPAEEIPLAGHPTIATAFGLVDSGRLAITEPRTRITLELKAGVIDVEIVEEPEHQLTIHMAQVKPVFMRTYDPTRVLPCLGLSGEDLLVDAVIQTVSTGTPQLMIPLAGLEALRRAEFDPPACRDLKDEGDFFSIHLFCMEGLTPAAQSFARHYVPPPDNFEDPFTGSATGGMGAYLWHHGLLGSRVFQAEQGHWMGRPGRATVEAIGPRTKPEGVRVGGNAITVVRGQLSVPKTRQ